MKRGKHQGEDGTGKGGPGLRAGTVLLLSLALWAPSAMATLAGNLDLTMAGLRYLAALAVARVAVGGIARMLRGYADRPADPAGQPRRRHDDPAGQDSSEDSDRAAS